MGLTGSRGQRSFTTKNKGSNNTTNNGNGRATEHTRFDTANSGDHNRVQNGRIGGASLASGASANYQTENEGSYNHVENIAVDIDSPDQTTAHLSSSTIGRLEAEYQGRRQARTVWLTTGVGVLVIAGLSLVSGTGVRSPAMIISLVGMAGVLYFILNRYLDTGIQSIKNGDSPPPYSKEGGPYSDLVL
ncbi:hypothetical protein VNI00_009435 [Paramarasmius palmivorus]|uniref:Transmembrane protein 230 n=1 Tax=Paramarasmius palmivorus TaxID=297713 RepID=A0AAW0CP09_9AGAR